MSDLLKIQKADRINQFRSWLCLGAYINIWKAKRITHAHIAEFSVSNLSQFSRFPYKAGTSLFPLIHIKP